MREHYFLLCEVPNAEAELQHEFQLCLERRFSKLVVGELALRSHPSN
jgi:hypothetical protein